MMSKLDVSPTTCGPSGQKISLAGRQEAASIPLHSPDTNSRRATAHT